MLFYSNYIIYHNMLVYFLFKMLYNFQAVTTIVNVDYEITQMRRQYDSFHNLQISLFGEIVPLFIIYKIFPSSLDSIKLLQMCAQINVNFSKFTTSFKHQRAGISYDILQILLF